MATITSLASGTGVGAGGTLDTGATVTASVDDWLVVIVACSNSGGSGAANTLTVDDSDGINTYTHRDTLNYDPGASGDGTTLYYYTCEVTDALTNATITIDFSDNPNSRCAQVYRVRPGTNEVVTYRTVGAGNTGGGVSSYSAGTVSVNSGEIIFGAASVETDDSGTGDADTTNGSWSTVVNRVADNGVDDDSTLLFAQYKAVTATGNQTWTGTTAGTNAYAANYLILNVDKVLSLSGGSHSTTGTAMSPERGRKVTLDAGSHATSGTDVSLSYTGAKILNVEGGSYSHTGTDASFYHGWEIVPEAAATDTTGTDATVKHGWIVTAEAGSHTTTGTDVSTEYGFRLDVTTAVGSHSHTGTDSAFQKSGAYSIALLGGSYTYTGTDISALIHGFEVVPEAGSHATTGTDATLRHGYLLFYDTAGSYSHAGTDIDATKTESAPVRDGGTLKVPDVAMTAMVGNSASGTVRVTATALNALTTGQETPRLKVLRTPTPLRVR
jgi:hypothetical protein